LVFPSIDDAERAAPKGHKVEIFDKVTKKIVKAPVVHARFDVPLTPVSLPLGRSRLSQKIYDRPLCNSLRHQAREEPIADTSFQCMWRGRLGERIKNVQASAQAALGSFLAMFIL